MVHPETTDQNYQEYVLKILLQDLKSKLFHHQPATISKVLFFYKALEKNKLKKFKKIKFKSCHVPGIFHPNQEHNRRHK